MQRSSVLSDHPARGAHSPAVIAASMLTALAAVLTTVVTWMAPASAAGTGPCDLYASGGTPCVAAHSTVRALYGSYNGNLYQVRRSSDNATKNIGVLSTGGVADAATQDSFCAGTTCVITVVYDQSGHGNDLWYQGPGGVGGSDTPAKATSESLTLNGSRAYSLYINPGNSYWRDGHLTGVPTGSAPEGMYMVTSGTHVNNGCCFDYGNSETSRKADGPGAMDSINFSTSCWFGGCSGSGPWVQADLEWGLYPGGSTSWNPNQRAFGNRYVTAMLKNNGTSRFAIKGGDAQSGGLTTLWDGSLPNGYSPMKKQGAIILGSGGDCCNGNTNLSAGTFYEGAIVSGYPSDATENAVQANLVAAGYGSGGGGSGGGIPTGWAKIANVTSGLTLDSGGNVSSGSALKQWGYDGSTNLQWQLVDLGNGYYRIVNRTNGMVADSWGNTANGASCLQAAWNGGNNQQWRLNSLGNGRYQIINRGTGTALDGAGSSSNGSATVLWTPNSSTNNEWTITAV
ncbi:arabinofuranosidase catalytic domain-containing protein [Actinoallomurus rhizosphaericola]|uniref:arabinofuranosidase catalytic domain-containing protein n=1 Tax=Actinoallomurus rhizosphaericola TaxID=2952536 RepID=UPI002092126F|nr:arabinofuranosidase catalytic domain-containing protein [Actinoallomurus rhizosphaericola]MCO5997890.1 RICIN domain-containing protein [Actinoallomurus rhizosphaericola]